MKKLLALLSLMLLVSGIAGAYTETLPPGSAVGTVPVSNGYDWSLSSGTAVPPIQLGIKTLAQLTALAPASTGSIYYCSNCTGTPVCVSSGTGVGAWVAVSTSSFLTNGCH